MSVNQFIYDAVHKSSNNLCLFQHPHFLPEHFRNSPLDMINRWNADRGGQMTWRQSEGRGGDVNCLLSCVRTYSMFWYCCCHYKHTLAKLASRQMDIIWTKDGTGCWQMAPVQGSVINIRIHTPLVTLTAFRLNFTVNPLTSSSDRPNENSHTLQTLCPSPSHRAVRVSCWHLHKTKQRLIMLSRLPPLSGFVFVLLSVKFHTPWGLSFFSSPPSPSPPHHKPHSSVHIRQPPCVSLSPFFSFAPSLFFCCLALTAERW